MANVKKTNAMRILDGKKIPYEIREYDDDGEHELSKGVALRTAEKLGVDPESVFKTIVMRTETKEICVFCQNSVREINLKKARNAANCREINTVKPEELLLITGYVRGGCSPLGMKKHFRTFIDESALLSEKICISGGQRGIQIILSPDDLVKATDAKIVDLKL